MTTVGSERIDTYHTVGSLTGRKQLLQIYKILLWDCGLLEDASGLCHVKSEGSTQNKFESFEFRNSA